MRRRMFFGAAGVAIFLLGLIAGVLSVNGFIASARAGNSQQRQANPGIGQYCQLYEQTLANKLGVQPGKLEQANVDALTAVIEQAATDGKITSFEKSAMEQQLAQFRSDPCGALTRLAAGQGTQAAPGLAAMASMARSSLVAAVAPKLGLTAQALTTDLDRGQTVAQIAHAKGADLGAAKTAYLNAAGSLLSQAVAGGFITQEQSTLASKALGKAVAQGHFPLLDRGSGASAIG